MAAIVVPASTPAPLRPSPTLGCPALRLDTVRVVPLMLPLNTASCVGMLRAISRLGALSVPRPVLSTPVPSRFCTAAAWDLGSAPAMVKFSPVSEAKVDVVAGSWLVPMLMLLRPLSRAPSSR